ncbi:MAG TPA: outer membrane protein assembly factor BamA [Verrucomicrobiae bacterium]
MCRTKALKGVWLSLCVGMLLVAWLPSTRGQTPGAKITKVAIEHLGPATVSDALIRANLRVKAGDPYLPAAVDDDIRNLYGTGQFFNVQAKTDDTADGVALTYVVQGNPRLTEIRFQGNKKLSESKLRKPVTSKVGESFNERKLFTDTQEILKLYQKKGYPRTEVKYTYSIDQNTGRATATFEITESPKAKIIKVEFGSAQAFTQRRLRRVIKTRKHWMFSWLTGSGYLKDEQFEEDQEKLREFYLDHGYLDFEIKKIDFLNPSPRTLMIRFQVYEGKQYRVGAVKFSGNKIFSTQDVTNGLRQVHAMKGDKGKTGRNGLLMDVGDVFRPKGLTKDVEDVEDFYGAKGYIDVGAYTRNLKVLRVPNIETGTMDLEFQIEEGQQSHIEKIDIRGNTKTKDKVIRRELAVSPGEVFDMVRVKLSKQRIEGLQYFDKVDARPEPTDIANYKNLIVGVEEGNPGHLTMGAGFSSVESLVGFVELTQGNFDLFQPPRFTGGGQRFRLRLAIGTEQQDYVVSFVEPWFLGRKLALGVDGYYRDLAYLSLDNVYDVVRAGGRVSLERTLGSDFLRGGISYGLEDVGIILNSGWNQTNTPPSIYDERGYSLLSRVGTSIAYDTRNSVRLPNKGQRTELDAEYVGGPLGGDHEFMKLELKTGWYFKGLFPGHVLELVGRTGVAKSFQSDHDVPFYERYYLGGLYSLRGFKYHSISPRDPLSPGRAGSSNPDDYYSEPTGGDTYWFGSAEYSIPIFEQERGIGVRFALFYDIGNVAAKPWTWNIDEFNDNWGIGLRLNLPIGPIRLDYGIPIHHDKFNSGSGQFQFGVGYTREF